MAAAAELSGAPHTAGVAHEAPDAAFASTALRKGAQLLKYCRRGKPHSCHVQLSPDESEIQWVSGAAKPRAVRLAAIKSLVPGQTTAVFKRQRGLHSERLSFSVLYTDKDGAERSLDLVCKDEEQLRLWYNGLRATHAKLSSPLAVAPGAQLQAAVRAAAAGLRWKLNTPSTPRRVQPLGGAQGSSERLSGALGLPAPPPPLPGEVFVWGHRADAPGGGRAPGALLPSVLPRSHGLDATAASLGAQHGALLSRAGHVFTWGCADHGRLGHGSQHHAAVPTRVEALVGVHVVQVACGEAQTAAVTDDGLLLMWGDTTLFGALGHSASRTQWVPRAVPLPGVVVLQVALGPCHGALVALDGTLYTWGEGAFGALGHDDCSPQLLPRRVAALAGGAALQVACGVWHTAALVRGVHAGDGAQAARLFTWGDGDKGQLGNGRKAAVLAPAVVEGELAGQAIKQVACGAFHTVALTAAGGVYVTGRDGSGGASKPAFRPVQGALAGLRADEVACGEAHTAVLASQRQRLYTWGCGAGGRLGHGDLSSCDVPKLVERLKDRDLRQLVCGPQCTAVVVACPQLSIEQKAALARSSDDAGRGGDKRGATPADAHSASRGNVPAAPATRAALLTQEARGSAAPGMGSTAAEWRARTLESDVHALRLSLRRATEEADALRAQLDASQSQVAELTRRLEAAATDTPATAEQPRDDTGAPAPASSPSSPRDALDVASAAPAEPAHGAQAVQEPTADFVQEVEPGVFVTVSAGHVLRRVRFDRRTFTDEQAQDWWEGNRAAVMGRLGLVLPSARTRRTSS